MGRQDENHPNNKNDVFGLNRNNKKPAGNPKIKQVKEHILTDNDILKYEIAEELGLTAKIRKSGWKSLTARESGKIGGLMAKKKKHQVNQ